MSEISPIRKDQLAPSSNLAKCVKSVPALAFPQP